jgi:hypothetical protein
VSYFYYEPASKSYMPYVPTSVYEEIEEETKEPSRSAISSESEESE